MFRTELTIAPAAGQLPRTARVLTMGSCFADSIGKRLEGHKVETRANPFGTVFQPLALARLLRAAAGEEVDWQQHLVEARGRWQSYDLHGSIGADSPVELLLYIQEVVRQTSEFLHHADVVVLTLGTAWAYRLRETGELVSNCHKQPADLFVRELLTPDEIINALAETHALLRRLNPELRFVLTVSPVRHLKDTLPLNTVSKSVLRLATHILSDLLPGVAYFPAFELLTDDLRDYRFYGADMLHPSEVAEEYIWDKFARTYFDADFGRFRKDWAAVQQALGHRPLHEGAPEHRQFLESTRAQLEQMSLRHVNVADELRTVHARLAALPLPRQPQPVAEPEDDEERIDIGDEAPAVVATKTAAPVVAATAVPQAAEAAQVSKITDVSGLPGSGEGRPPRLSPEEFRAQRAARPARPERGRRDGRGKDQSAQPSEAEQFQAASFAEADEFAQPPLLPMTPATELRHVASATEATPGASATPLETAAQEAASKKKRRSRGGAKRTARKNALRLAGEMGLDEGQVAASDAALEAAAALAGTLVAGAPAASTGRPPVGREPREAQDSRAPRNDRRREDGRGVARMPLFAVPEASDLVSDEATAQVTDVAAVASPAVTNAGGEVADTASDGQGSSARKSRNRKKKKGNRTANGGTIEADVTGAANASLPAQPLPRGAEVIIVDNAEALAAARTDDRRDNNRRNGRNNRDNNQRQPALPRSESGAVVTTPVVFVAATPVASAATGDAASGATVIVTDSGQSNTGSSSPKKPSKRKGRAMVGGRSEKPEFDTPIIPVSDFASLPTQVAAGRLMGTSASLVESTPTKPGKVAGARNAATSVKPTASKSAPSKGSTQKAAAQPATAAGTALSNAAAGAPPAALVTRTASAGTSTGKSQSVAKAKANAPATSTNAPKAAPRQSASAASKATKTGGAPAGKGLEKRPAGVGQPGRVSNAADSDGGAPAQAVQAAKAVAKPGASAAKAVAPAAKAGKATKPTAQPAVKETVAATAVSAATTASTTKVAPAAKSSSVVKNTPGAKAVAVIKATATKAQGAAPAAKKPAAVGAPVAKADTPPATKAPKASATAKPPVKTAAKASAKVAPAAQATAKPAGKAKAPKKPAA